MISLSLGRTVEQLRREFTLWLKDNPPPRVSSKISLEDFVVLSREWQARLASGRWIAVHWPEQYGGRGLSLVEEAMLQECLAASGSPQLVNLFGLTMVGPVLIEHGTEEQRRRFLPKILTAEEIWCQGFSEPEAGSDLASVRTRGTRVAENGTDQWSISGQKVWTSFAQAAAWCFLLVKTESDAPRYESLSYLLVPMSTPGITVRPLMQISGDREFNELFLEDARIPADHIVGRPGEGWKIAISTLMYERVVLTFARHLQSEQMLQQLYGLLRTGSPDAAAFERCGELRARSMAVRALALSHLLSYERDGVRRAPCPEGSLDKLGWSETFQNICKTALDTLGPGSVLCEAVEGDRAINGAPAQAAAHVQHQYLYSRGRTIAAGTSEVQRNIIAERVLALPRQR